MNLFRWHILTGIIILFYSCNGPDGRGKAHSADSASTGKMDSVAPEADDSGAGGMRSHPIHLQKGIDLRLRLPAGYEISVACEELDRPRFLYKSPDHRLFVTDMFDISDNKEGKVYIFGDWDSAAKQYKTIHTYLDSLHNPNQIGFYREKGKNWLYLAETGTLTRYVYHAGDTIPSGKPELIARFPDYGLDYKYGGWHLTRSIAFHDHKLYVSVGSSCNACIEKEGVRATIMEMNPDGSDKKFFATGLRNSVAIKWIGDKLWATYMGRDLIGADRPQDLFETVQRGKFYGWPYYFQDHDSVCDDTAMQRDAREQGLTVPSRPAPAYCGFMAHSAPLGFEYFKNFDDELLKNAFLVALHGSTDVALRRGNAIVKILGPNKYIPVVDGFLTGSTDKDRKGRPCDILMDSRRSFFFTDDLNGVLYYVWKK
jgi:glucose/arabinose dehydrogenase